jgi:hypothetical protein
MLTVGGLLVVLIPITGLTLRFAVKPFLRDLAEARGARTKELPLERDDRLDRIERQMEDIERSVRRLADVSEFDRQLRSGPPEPPSNDV